MQNYEMMFVKLVTFSGRRVRDSLPQLILAMSQEQHVCPPYN